MHYFFLKNKVYVLLMCVVVFSLAGSVFAETITLTNPLCPNGPGTNGCVNNLPDLIKKIIDYISLVVGALAVLMFVIAGIYFVISGGNPEKINKAKSIAIYAVIGLAIALLGEGLTEVIEEVIG